MNNEDLEPTSPMKIKWSETKVFNLNEQFPQVQSAATNKKGHGTRGIGMNKVPHCEWKKVASNAMSIGHSSKPKTMTTTSTPTSTSTSTPTSKQTPTSPSSTESGSSFPFPQSVMQRRREQVRECEKAAIESSDEEEPSEFWDAIMEHVKELEKMDPMKAKKQTEQSDVPLSFIGSDESTDEGDLNQLNGEEYRKFSAYIDSGAIESVAPRKELPEFAIRESAGSRRGQHYATANGARIPNEGEQMVEALTNEYVPVQMKYQVANVTKALCSVGQVCDQDNAVLFTKTGGYILNLRNKWKTPFSREGKMYVLDTWVKNKTTADGEQQQQQRQLPTAASF